MSDELQDIIAKGTVEEEGELVVRVGSNVENYRITTVPRPDASLVTEAKKDVLSDLSLDSFLRDLGRSCDLMYLAFVGVKGTPLAGRVGGRQMDLASLCGDCTTSMRRLHSGSSDVATSLTKAYSFLLKGQESRAIKHVARCSDYADKMATKCGELSSRFQTMATNTLADSKAVEEALAIQAEEMAKMQEAKAEMEASQAEQVSIMAEMEASIAKLNEDIAKEHAQEDEDDDEEEVEVEPSDLALEIIYTLQSAVGAGLGVYMPAMVPASDGASSSASRSISVKTDSEKQKKKKKKKESMRDENIRSARDEMFKKRGEHETKKAQAIAQLAKMVSLLNSSSTNERAEIATSAMSSLQIAAFLFSNLAVSLSNAKSFWDKMSENCNHCATLALRKKDAQKKEAATQGDRIAIYKDESFMKAALNYLVRWAALSYVCEEYVGVSDSIKTKVLTNIRNNPSVKEARQMVGPLKQKLLEELAADQAASEQRAKKLLKEEEEEEK